MSEPSRPASPTTPGPPSEHTGSAARARPDARPSKDVPSRDVPSKPVPSRDVPSKPVPSKYVDFFLYASAAVTYVSLSIYNKWLLDWIVGPFWLVAWVWGLPALVRLARRQPVRPQRPRPSEAE